MWCMWSACVSKAHTIKCIFWVATCAHAHASVHVHAKGAYKKCYWGDAKFFWGVGPKAPTRSTTGARSWGPLGPPIF